MEKKDVVMVKIVETLLKPSQGEGEGDGERDREGEGEG